MSAINGLDIVLAISAVAGTAVFIFYMVRGNKTEPPQSSALTAFTNRSMASTLPPPPPQNEQNTINRLLRQTPIDKQVKQITSAQHQQADQFKEVNERLREMRAAIELKPDPEKPASTKNRRKQTEDAGWKKEQEGKSDRKDKHEEKEDADWKKEQEPKQPPSSQDKRRQKEEANWQTEEDTK